MKVWQDPGSQTPAEWLALTVDPHWEDAGGVWAQEVEPNSFLVVVVGPDLEHEDAVHAQAKWLDLAKLTLPEQLRICGETLDLLAVVRSGWGLPIGAHVSQSARGARARAKSLALDFEPHSVKLEAQMHHRRWARLRVEDPVGYLAGFLSGMRRGSVDTSSEDKVFLAGWEHGWEHAVGRAPLPEWFSLKVEEAVKKQR